MNISDIIAAATPEQQRGFKLEEIFMPEARRQRADFYSSANPRFVHYTRADAALSIIQKKRMWLRNTTAMVDYREVQHGFDLLLGWFTKDDNREKFKAAFDAIHPGAAVEAITKFDALWQRTDVGIRVQTYIASVSVHDSSEDNHGRLSMWRAFGTDSTARVALIFKVPPLSGAVDFLQCLFSPVAYLGEDRAHEILSEVLGNVQREGEFLKTVPYAEIVNLIFFTLVIATVCVKHEGFREEKEWRLVYLPGFYPPRDPPLIKNDIEIVSGVPQIVYKFPLDVSVAPEIAELDIATMFDRLILGPVQFPFVMYEAFRKALEEAGVADAGSRVITSTIPIRS